MSLPRYSKSVFTRSTNLLRSGLHLFRVSAPPRLSFFVSCCSCHFRKSTTQVQERRKKLSKSSLPAPLAHSPIPALNVCRPVR